MRIRSRARIRASLYAGVAAVAVIAALALPGPGWRAHAVAIGERIEILYLASQGEIAGLSFREALSIVRLHSPYSFRPLVLSRNAYRAIANPYVSPNDVAIGSTLYRAECASCHGPDADGGNSGPSLLDRAGLKYGDSEWRLYQTIRDGISGTTMPPHAWAERRIWQTVAYLNSLPASEAQGASQGMTEGVVAVSARALENIQNPARDWLTYAGSYSSTRHSDLAQITGDNIDRLAPKWIFQFSRERYRLEDSALEDHGIVFANAPDAVVALDARTGSVLWQFERRLPPHVRGCCGVISRGLAMLGDRLYFATYDGKLISLSASTGTRIWEVPVADYHQGYSITAAPLAYGHLIVTGVGGGESPMRGFIAAYDAITGKQVWRFWTVPAPGEPGSETWPANGAWRHGGGGTWMTGSYDPTTGVLYWGVGNPNPDFNNSGRRGDDLYTDSVVALAGGTGKLLWHFQFTPDDVHDYDAVQMPELIDRPGNPELHELLVANRNGFFYALDRTNGRFLFGKAFMDQTWTRGLTASGRPVPNAEAEPTAGGTLAYPGNTGATNWWPASYDPTLDLFFVPAVSEGSYFYRSPAGSDEVPPSPYRHGPVYSSVLALDGATGAVVWRYQRPGIYGANWHRAGVLSTAGGIVFSAQGSTFYALNSRTGKLLWSFGTGADIVSAPVSYEVDGQQYILVASGNSLIAFGLVASGATRESSPATSRE